MPTEAELRKMTVKELKQHIRDMNMTYAIKRYSTLRKEDLIKSILFAHHELSKASKSKPSAPSAPKRKPTKRKPPAPKPSKQERHSYNVK